VGAVESRWYVYADIGGIRLTHGYEPARGMAANVAIDHPTSAVNLADVSQEKTVERTVLFPESVDCSTESQPAPGTARTDPLPAGAARSLL
jgi:hypothetical protein